MRFAPTWLRQVSPLLHMTTLTTDYIISLIELCSALVCTVGHGSKGVLYNFYTDSSSDYSNLRFPNFARYRVLREEYEPPISLFVGSGVVRIDPLRSWPDAVKVRVRIKSLSLGGGGRRSPC